MGSALVYVTWSLQQTNYEGRQVVVVVGCVCVCVCMCACVYATCVHEHVCVCTYVYMCMHVCPVYMCICDIKVVY